MNKKDQLLAETLGDGDGESFAGIAAAHARRRLTVKRYSLPAIVLVAMVTALTATRQPTSKSQPAAVHAPVPSLEIISDEELLAQLRDEPVLILKDGAGIAGVVFLADSSGADGNHR
jgi:hypothetical protein